MSLKEWFRLSQYLTLGLSCTALVFAEDLFLPELQLCLAPVLALLLLAWWVEGRWHLPNWGANILGVLIAGGGITWLVTQLSDDSFVLAHLPLHLALLPYMGPLSMAALLVKVFRVHDAGHFWHLQGWGLLQIGLGCLLDGGPAFGAMMMAYLASDLICLALHYRLATRHQPPGVIRPLVAATDETDRRNSESGKWVAAFTLRWTLLICGTALLLFLLTPRSDSWSWQPLNRLRTGYRGSNQGTNEEMNLNSTGWVELDDGIAVRVAAIDSSGEPKLDLPGGQRWRSSVLDWYEHGRWTTMHLLPTRPRQVGQVELPDFGSEQYYLTFTVQPRQAGGLVLAEPIRLGSYPNRLPVIALGNDDRRRLFAEFSGTVLSQVPAEQRGEYRYCQVIPVLNDPERIPAENLWPNDFMELLRTLSPSLHAPFQSWTVELLRRLAERPHYRLPEEVRLALAQPQQNYRFPPAYWEVVARALTDYLARSGEYTYSLEIVRRDRLLDPTLDFLINIKKGHCERYAAALALMLRSVGIPARVIKGYRGCENQQNGQYLVRHNHAHAWVEILVPHSPTKQEAGLAPHRRPYYDWLTLDATPAEPVAPTDNLSLFHLWDGAGRFCLQWWRALILEYDSDEQADLWNTLMSMRALSLLLYLALVAAMCAAGFVAWRLLRRLPRPRAVARIRGDDYIYHRLVKILARYVSLRPRYGQTPREYSAEAQMVLSTRPNLAALADLPRRVVELFYRVRFGCQPLNIEERQQLKTDLDHLAEALRNG